MFAGLAYDWIRRRQVHPVYLLGGAILIIVHFSRLFLASTPQWRQIAERLLAQVRDACGWDAVCFFSFVSQ